MVRMSTMKRTFEDNRRKQIDLMRAEAETLPEGNKRALLLMKANALENAAGVSEAFLTARTFID